MKILCRDLGRMDYAAAWELQQRLFDGMVARKAARGIAPAAKLRSASAHAADGGRGVAGAGPFVADDDRAGELLLVEHDPVYTLGKSGRAENLLVGRERLEALGATFFRIDRGGDITFHGPGQLVCYPILDLERLSMGLRDYIGALEEAVIRTVADYGIAAGRIAGASGVWIVDEKRPPRKICAIGVRSSRYITMHGFALNVATDLSWFAHINPCGFADRGVASIAGETGREAAMDDVKRRVVAHLGEVLGAEMLPAGAAL
ncbi:MAG: lipoyl(octanoyl) transferase LipB [Alistipes sp.]|nr:lipoyl(octanoyl) transferase LipB [Alistipes sp.]